MNIRDDVNYIQLKRISQKAGERLLELLEKDTPISGDTGVLNTIQVLSSIVIAINSKFCLERHRGVSNNYSAK